MLKTKEKIKDSKEDKKSIDLSKTPIILQQNQVFSIRRVSTRLKTIIKKHTENMF